MKLPNVNITIEMLVEIYQHYNPLGQKHTFLVDDFLIWSQKEGDFYWIWGGAVELADGKDDPKEIIKELPFMKLPSDYKDLLVEAWLQFLNNDEKRRESMLEEYTLITNIPF
jgi:hypothetical protein